MKTVLRVVAVIFILLGVGLFGFFRGIGASSLANNAKGAFATVASSGNFWGYGMLLIGIGIVCFLVQAVLKD